MNPNKALGPDGMTACFFQRYWFVVGIDITEIILRWLNGEESLQSVNHTNIVLIPKTSSPCNPQQFRSISLCNVLYKIIAKVLANRLKGVLQDVIA